MFLTYFTATAFGRWVGIGLVLTVVLLGSHTYFYFKGRSAGAAAYKAKIEREIKKATDKGDKARADALKDFDKNSDSYSDPFERLAAIRLQ